MWWLLMMGIGMSLLTGCGNVPDSKLTLWVDTITVDGHRFVVITDGRGLSSSHSPDCPCKKGE